MPGPDWPVEPPETPWVLPAAADLDAALDAEDLVAVGADLAPGTVLAAYRRGLFPMPVRLGRRHRRDLGWWSPDPRAILPLDGLVVSRSLRRSLRRYRVTVDQAFDDVVAGCADRRRPGRWITDEVADAYRELHLLGWTHSLEVWDPAGALVGGLYGVCVGGLFAGESMFHRAPDASKVALVRLVGLLGEDSVPRLLDVQWATEHLTRLGAVEVPRSHYAQLLAAALRLPPPQAFCQRPAGPGVSPSGPPAGTPGDTSRSDRP